MNLAQLIDLEAQIARDRAAEDGEAGEWEEVLERDRAIAAELQDHAGPELFLAWLTRARSGHALPGERMAEAWSTFRILLAVAGLFAGAGLVLALKNSLAPGPPPYLNLTVFWSGLVGLQLVLLVLLGLAGLVAALGAESPARWLAGGQALVHRLGRWLMTRALHRHFPEHARRLESGLGRLSGKRLYYGRLLRWMAMEASQRFALAFNLAALLALFLLGEMEQLNFGWSSTRSDGAWFPAAVQALSLPWKAVFPLAVPGQEVIEATRMPAPVPLAHAVEVWWYFLLMNLAVYGLALRSLLWACSAWRLRAALRALPLDHEDFLRLRNRLTRSWFVEPAATRAASLLVWGVLPERMVGAVEARMHELHGTGSWRPAGHQADPAGDAALCETLAAEQPGRVVLMIPVWNEPQHELKDFMRQLRDALGEQAVLVIDLVDVDDTQGLQAVDAPRKMIWESFLNQLRDPNLNVLASGAGT